MAKTNSTTPTVIPLDPALNEWVDRLVEGTLDLYDSEEEARGVATEVGFAVRRCDREQAASGVPANAYCISSPSMEEALAWMSAASPELNAEMRT